MFSHKLFIALAAVITSASAAAVATEVDRPVITAPKAGDLWTVGSTQTVSWDTATLSAQSGETGLILLGFIEADDPSGNEHLDINHPLASGFDLSVGAINVTVPDVDSRDDYVVVVFGDSGNTSPLFSILN